MKLLKKSAIAAAIALACTGAQAADTTISAYGVTATINDAGTFASYYETPGTPVGTPGLAYNGVEFVNWGIPTSYNWLKIGSTDYPSLLGSNPRVGTTGMSFPTGQVASSFSAGGLSVLQTFSIVSPGKLNVSVTFTNVADGGGAVSGVRWGVGLDPDQGRSPAGGGGPDTYNKIIAQGSGASVTATDTAYGTLGSINLANDTSIGAFQVKAYIDGACCSAVDPAISFAGGQSAGYSVYGDYSISLSYDIGTLADGQSGTIGYAYNMAPIPEPETYAMLLAGLGLMGFVARRRKQNAAA